MVNYKSLRSHCFYVSIISNYCTCICLVTKTYVDTHYILSFILTGGFIAVLNLSIGQRCSTNICWFQNWHLTVECDLDLQCLGIKKQMHKIPYWLIFIYPIICLHYLFFWSYIWHKLPATNICTMGKSICSSKGHKIYYKCIILTLYLCRPALGVYGPW